MDRNATLAAILSMLVFTSWLMWQGQRAGPPVPPEGSLAVSEQTVARAESAGELEGGVLPSSPLTPVTPQAPVIPVVPSGITIPVLSGAPDWKREYTRELYTAALTNRGAGLTSWALHRYSRPTPEGDVAVDLVEDFFELPALATPFTELGLGDLSRANFQVESEDEEGVIFRLESGGVTIRKIYTLNRDGYGFQLELSVENQSAETIKPRFEVLWPVQKRDGTDFNEQGLATLHAGSVERERIISLGSPGFFKKTFGNAGTQVPTFHGDIDWAAIDNKYFIAALLPDRTRDTQVIFQPIEKGSIAILSVSFSAISLPPGQTVAHVFRGFVGPKETALLEEVSPTLERSVDRGWAWVSPLARFFEWMLNACYSVIPNFGVAIIILTVLVRLVTMPVMGRQMRSMERMRALQPKLTELKERFGDDRQKQSEEMMKLYRTEGVNPLGGCLPMLLQFPVFIGLFYSLRSAIELRQAPFVGWITDLSVPEALFVIPGIDIPFRVLPLVMGVSMIAQQKLTPTTADPAQAKMMATIMPIMFTVMFYQFPSGLVLYWMISNFLGIGHQLWVGKRMRAAA